MDEEPELTVRAQPGDGKPWTTHWEITGLHETAVDLQVLRLQFADGCVASEFSVPQRIWIDGVRHWRSTGHTMEEKT